MAFPFVAAAIVGSSILSSVMGASAGKKASQAQLRAAEMDIAERRRQFDLSRSDMAPWLQTGGGALQALARLYGLEPPAEGQGRYDGFFTSPGYEFRRDEGIRSIERSAASRGLLRSGAAVKAIERFAEGNAASEYQAFADRLAQMAGFGQNAASSNAAVGQNTAQGIGQAYRDMGNARASSYVNTANAVNSGVNNMLTAYLYSRGGGFG